jgi:hypothetical protein
MSVYTNTVLEMLYVLERNDELRHRLLDVLQVRCSVPKSLTKNF